MSEYKLRAATLNDIDFLAVAIIAAEKSNSEKAVLTSVFHIEEKNMKQLITKMLNEEIDGCEFSVSSFLLLTFENKPVAAIGGWVEGLTEKVPSRTLKSNLIGFTFPKENLQQARQYSSVLNSIQIDREEHALQIEYVYVSAEHRKKKLGDRLIAAHIDRAREQHPALNKAQVQVFANNTAAIKLYERNGFSVTKSFTCSEPNATELLPFHQKLLMEKLL